MRTERRTDTPDEADSRFSQTFELFMYFVCQLQYRQLQYGNDTQEFLSTTSYCSFIQHTALIPTNPPADHTVLDRLTSYILCTFLLQYTSCVMLSISSYEHPYGNPAT